MAMTQLLTQTTQFHGVILCSYTVAYSNELIVRSSQFLALLENTKLKEAQVHVASNIFSPGI